MVVAYTFKGKHGEMVADLTGEQGIAFFDKNVDVYLTAPIIGMRFQRTAKPESSANGNTKRQVNPEQYAGHYDKINATYQLVMLLDGKEIDPLDVRIDRAFRYQPIDERRKDEEGYKVSKEYLERKRCDERFEEYLLGGVEVLHEKLIGQAEDKEDILMNLYEFIKNFDEDLRLVKQQQDLFKSDF
jgi:hypothetical protein